MFVIVLGRGIDKVGFFGLEIEKMVVMKASFAKWPNGKLGET